MKERNHHTTDLVDMQVSIRDTDEAIAEYRDCVVYGGFQGFKLLMDRSFCRGSLVFVGTIHYCMFHSWPFIAPCERGVVCSARAGLILAGISPSFEYLLQVVRDFPLDESSHRGNLVGRIDVLKCNDVAKDPSPVPALFAERLASLNLAVVPALAGGDEGQETHPVCLREVSYHGWRDNLRSDAAPPRAPLILSGGGRRRPGCSIMETSMWRQSGRRARLEMGGDVTHDISLHASSSGPFLRKEPFAARLQSSIPPLSF